MDKENLRAYLIDEAGYSANAVNHMSSWELLNAWLRYNGIIGYTNDIIEVVEAAFAVELNW